MPKKKEQPDRMKWQDEMLEITRLRRERDTLLAALRFCEAADIARRGGDQSYEDDRIERTANAAIAEVEGKP